MIVDSAVSQMLHASSGSTKTANVRYDAGTSWKMLGNHHPTAAATSTSPPTMVVKKPIAVWMVSLTWSCSSRPVWKITYRPVLARMPISSSPMYPVIATSRLQTP